ncbi:MAG: hypothetical protein LBM18_04850 [Oscillospiraceae bacterium]|jgi:hypothetical protein|nr:hypothetical protein [Oscillospiraceae bacterium]
MTARNDETSSNPAETVKIEDESSEELSRKKVNEDISIKPYEEEKDRKLTSLASAVLGCCVVFFMIVYFVDLKFGPGSDIGGDIIEILKWVTSIIMGFLFGSYASHKVDHNKQD